MSLDVDFKIITWERITVPDSHAELVLEKLKSGEITTGEEIFHVVADAELSRLDDVDTYISPKENDGYSTIEVLNEEGETIWDNSKL